MIALIRGADYLKPIKTTILFCLSRKTVEPAPLLRVVSTPSQWRFLYISIYLSIYGFYDLSKLASRSVQKVRNTWLEVKCVSSQSKKLN